jgi:Mrp family chromosome partitioning ATPase
MQRLQEVSVERDLRSGNIHIIEWASLPTSPFWPRKALNLALALLLGLTSGVGLAFLQERRDDTVRTVTSTERLFGIPSLGSIPAVKSAHNGANPGKALVTRQLATLPTLPIKASQAATCQITDIPEALPGSVEWDALRSALIPILFSGTDPPRKILVTSPLPGEGKSTIVVNFGRILAGTGARTVIVDLNRFHKSPLEAYGFPEMGGSGTYFAGHIDDVPLGPEAKTYWNIRETGVESLFVLAGGEKAAEALEMLQAYRIQQFLQPLTSSFGFVLLETSSVLSVTDSLLCAPAVDAVVLVVKDRETLQSDVHAAIRRLKSAQARIIGIVINGVDQSDPSLRNYAGFPTEDRFFLPEQDDHTFFR